MVVCVCHSKKEAVGLRTVDTQSVVIIKVTFSDTLANVVAANQDMPDKKLQVAMTEMQRQKYEKKLG